MGFKSLFKVRRPGHGDAFQKSVEKAGKRGVSVSPMKDNSFNSKDKKSI